MNHGLVPVRIAKPGDHSDDRTVHAALPDGGLLVRYDKASKWFVEFPPDTGRKRVAVTLNEGAQRAVDSVGVPGCFVALGRPGGTNFNVAYHRLLHARPERPS